jgi:hypothetical protein
MKVLEIRDRATYIPVIAVRLEPHNEHERYLLATAGYGTNPAEQAAFVLVSRINGGHCETNVDPHAWTGRTMPVAHRYIEQHFDELQPFDVVDVENILGETVSPKVSEALCDD